MRLKKYRVVSVTIMYYYLTFKNLFRAMTSTWQRNAARIQDVGKSKELGIYPKNGKGIQVGWSNEEDSRSWFFLEEKGRGSLVLIKCFKYWSTCLFSSWVSTKWKNYYPMSFLKENQRHIGFSPIYHPVIWIFVVCWYGKAFWVDFFWLHTL